MKITNLKNLTDEQLGEVFKIGRKPLAVGDFVLIDGELYLLVRIGRNSCAFIGIKSANRYAEGEPMFGSVGTHVTKKEARGLLGLREYPFDEPNVELVPRATAGEMIAGMNA